jgi:hypothetical protein
MLEFTLGLIVGTLLNYALRVAAILHKRPERVVPCTQLGA